jgi:hypothetical protein
VDRGHALGLSGGGVDGGGHAVHSDRPCLDGSGGEQRRCGRAARTSLAGDDGRRDGVPHLHYHAATATGIFSGSSAGSVSGARG